MPLLSEDDKVKTNEWDENHNCKLKDQSVAIGGRLTYCYTPTGLGVITVVKCACGEKIDLTEYSLW